MRETNQLNLSEALRNSRVIKMELTKMSLEINEFIDSLEMNSFPTKESVLYLIDKMNSLKVFKQRYDKIWTAL